MQIAKASLCRVTGNRPAFTLFSGGAGMLYRRVSVLLHCLGR